MLRGSRGRGLAVMANACIGFLFWASSGSVLALGLHAIAAPDGVILSEADLPEEYLVRVPAMPNGPTVPRFLPDEGAQTQEIHLDEVVFLGCAGEPQRRSCRLFAGGVTLTVPVDRSVPTPLANFLESLTAPIAVRATVQIPRNGATGALRLQSIRLRETPVPDAIWDTVNTLGG